MDPDSTEIIVGELTNNGSGGGDNETGQRLIKKIPKGIKRVFGDGAYDGIDFRRRVEEIDAEPIIPPPRDAVIHGIADLAFMKRDNAVREIAGLGGDDGARRLWKKLKGYHRRLLGETTMYRIKQLTGSSLKSREWKRQCVETYVKYLAINMMTKLGMPIGRWKEVA